jgi:hypothetical protein
MPRDPNRESGIDDPGDETLEALNRPLEDLSEDDSEGEHQPPIPSRTPTPPPDEQPPPDAQPPPEEDEEEAVVMAQVPTAQQLATIPVYDGTRGDAYVNWINLVKHARGAYGWDHRAILQVVRIKGGPKVQEWLHHQELRGIQYDCWNLDAGAPANTHPMEEPMRLRFGPRYTSTTAVMAVSNLTQRADESCAEFMDRVVIAVEKMHYNVNAAVKATDGYRDTQKFTILSLFGAGLKESISKVVLAQSIPPADVPEMLAAAEAVEAEQSKKQTPTHLSAFEVSDSGEAAASPTDYEDNAPDTETLWEQVQEDLSDLCLAVTQSMDMSRIRCFNCQRFGHFARNCPRPRRRSSFQPRGRGTPRQRRDTRLDQRRRPFGPSRATMAIEEVHSDEDAESVFEEEQGNN